MKNFIDRHNYWPNRYECDGKYGIEDCYGNAVVACEYDSIFSTTYGFILCKNSKFGYIDFVNDIDVIHIYQKYTSSDIYRYLPCRYDRIDEKNHGLQLYRMAHYDNDEFVEEKIDWYDFKERKIYHNYVLMDEFVDYDCFTRKDLYESGIMPFPFLKRAGKDEFIDPQDDISFLYPMPSCHEDDVKLFICKRRISMSYDEIMANESLKDKANEFLSQGIEKEDLEFLFDEFQHFFLVIGKDGSWWETEAKSSIDELYEIFPKIKKAQNEKFRRMQKEKRKQNKISEGENDKKSDNL